MFRSSVREFAEGELRPRVEEMDEKGKLDPALIKQCFDLGLMGIETPEEFGLTNVRPMNAYAFLYPFSNESLMRIAYHFDFNYRLGEAPTGFADDVIRFTEAWQHKEERGLLCSVRQPDGSLLLRDTRPGATMREVRLSGSDAAAYEFCDEFRSVDGIVRHLREYSPQGEPTEEGVRAFLESLAANRLMLTDGRNWLSLAVRVRGVQRGKVVGLRNGLSVGRNAENNPYTMTRISNTR